MTVRRIMGLETEFGISVPGDPMANPMFLSGQVVSVYAAAHGIRSNQSSWDYTFEDPLRDARGWQLDRQNADESQLTDVEDPTLANVVLPNGARYYVDHAHPEYSSPEVTSPRDAIAWDRAGDAIALESVRLLAERPGQALVNLYKNNADGKGQSYGTHENYLMPRRTPFPSIVKHLIPFFVTRQVICGAGRVGLGVDSREAGFQVSQRADFFETEVGLETTLKRPIVNTRDEPHCDASKYRRLHVIVGDANMSEVATFLKVGATALILAMIEDDVLGDELVLANPVAAIRQVSHDPTLARTILLRNGRRATAVEIQWALLERSRKYEQSHGLSAIGDDVGTEVLALWESVLTGLEHDPASVADVVDWVAKQRLVEGYAARHDLRPGDIRLKNIDLQYHDMRPDRCLARRVGLREMISAEDVRSAMTEPPTTTRAYFRGRCLAKWPDEIVAANWDSLVFDVGREPLRRVPMMEPLRGTADVVARLIDDSDTPFELLARLGG